MLKKTSNLWKELKRNKYVYLSQLLLALVICVDYSIGINIDRTLGNWFYVLPIATVAVLSVPLFADWKLYRAKYFVLAIYTVVIGIFLGVFTEIFGPYFQILLLLLFSYTYWYRRKGLLIGAVASFAILTTAAYYQFSEISPSLW